MTPSIFNAVNVPAVQAVGAAVNAAVAATFLLASPAPRVAPPAAVQRLKLADLQALQARWDAMGQAPLSELQGRAHLTRGTLDAVGPLLAAASLALFGLALAGAGYSRRRARGCSARPARRCRRCAT